MKRYTMSWAAAMEHKPEHPERTARRETRGWDVEFQVWPSRAAMLKTVEMQGRSPPSPFHWRPVVKATAYATPEVAR